MSKLVDFVITAPVLILVLGCVQAEEQHAEPPPEAGRLQELHQEGHKARYGRQVELEATKIDMSNKLRERPASSTWTASRGDVRHGRQVELEARWTTGTAGGFEDRVRGQARSTTDRAESQSG